MILVKGPQLHFKLLLSFSTCGPAETGSINTALVMKRPPNLTTLTETVARSTTVSRGATNRHQCHQCMRVRVISRRSTEFTKHVASSRLLAFSRRRTFNKM